MAATLVILLAETLKLLMRGGICNKFNETSNLFHKLLGRIRKVAQHK